MTWTTLGMEVTTPLFNGGADVGQDNGDGIRVASVRGAMRFWFRALAGTVAGPDLELLGGMERAVFGDAGHSSPVQLRIPRQPKAIRRPQPDFTDGDGGKYVLYLLGQGLTEYKKAIKKTEVTRPYVDAGRSFDLKLRCADEETGALALASLRLCCLYGGFGARTRRGWGGIKITGSDSDLPGPWTESGLKGAGIADHRGRSNLFPAGELADCRDILFRLRSRILKDLNRPSGTPDFEDNWEETPSYPVLSQNWTACGLSGETFPSWDEALCRAGFELRYFRASQDYPSAKYSPKIKTPEWEEVVWGNSDHFKVGALGLPVVYKDNNVVNVVRGNEKLRRASPLWLRAVGSDGEWRVLSFAFLGQFLPGPSAPSVRLARGNGQQRDLRVADDDIRSLADQWIETLAADESFEDTTRQ